MKKRPANAYAYICCSAILILKRYHLPTRKCCPVSCSFAHEALAVSIRRSLKTVTTADERINFLCALMLLVAVRGQTYLQEDSTNVAGTTALKQKAALKQTTALKQKAGLALVHIVKTAKAA